MSAPRASALFAASVLALSAAAATSAHAQAPSISMRTSRTQMQVGDTFRLEIEVSAAGSAVPELPDLSMFDEVSRSTSQQVQLGFGHGPQVSTVYSFWLRAVQPGRFDLPAPRLNAGGRVVTGTPLTIVVGGSGVPPATSSNQAPQQVPSTEPPTGTLDGATYDDQAFLRTVVDRTDPYVGQQVTVTIYLYVRGALRAAPPVTREATTDGFWVHDLLPPTRSFDATTQVVGSTPFRVYVLRRFAAFPLREGELTIGAPTVQVPMGNVFDIFVGGPQPDLERTGVPIRIDARPLPGAGRPAGEVHVGQLGLEATLDRTQVPTGDAVTLTVRAIGSGHVQALRLEAPARGGVRVLAPQTHDEMSAPGDVVGGTRVFEWLMVPEREGTYSIPAFRVATFDPASEQYRVVESAPLELVAAGNPVGGAAAPDAPEAIEARDGLPELGPVRTESALERRRSEIVGAPWFPWLLGAFPLAWLGLVAGVAWRRRAAARAGTSTPQKVSKQARQRLAKAESLAAAGDARGFYAALTLAIKAVLEGRLGESVGSLTQRQLERRLVERGMDETLARRVVEELEGHEMVRFSASGAQPSEMQEALGRAREIIDRLDRFVAIAEDER